MMCSICGRYCCVPTCPQYMGYRVGNRQIDIVCATGQVLRRTNKKGGENKHRANKQLRKSEISRRGKCRFKY